MLTIAHAQLVLLMEAVMRAAAVARRTVILGVSRVTKKAPEFQQVMATVAA